MPGYYCKECGMRVGDFGKDGKCEKCNYQEAKRNRKKHKSPFFTARQDKRDIRLGAVCKNKSAIIDRLWKKGE